MQLARSPQHPPQNISCSGIEARLAAFHEGRDLEILAQKLELIGKDAFSFFRGTCFLFYEDLDTESLPESPLVWATGDLHLQNFGTYKGDNRLCYFDVNDFDECGLVPASFELVRMCASIYSANFREPDKLTASFLGAYASTLQRGKAIWLERATSRGPIRDLLLDLKNRKRAEFLAKRVKKEKIVADGRRAMPLPKARIEELAKFFGDYSKHQVQGQRFFRLIDAARRVAGNGSLGLERYALLVEGRGGSSGAFLLDLKVQPGSALLRANGVPAQPQFASEAERVATIQFWSQSVSPALLDAVTFEGRSFLLHELLPTDDRLDFAAMPATKAELCLKDMGGILASSHLRSAGRKGSAGPEELMRFGASGREWESQLLDSARTAAAFMTAHWAEYRKRRVASKASKPGKSAS